MAIADRSESSIEFKHTAVGGEVQCRNCHSEGEQYRYNLGTTHGKLVLCDDCATIKRMRDGRGSLTRVRDGKSNLMVDEVR